MWLSCLCRGRPVRPLPLPLPPSRRSPSFPNPSFVPSCASWSGPFPFFPRTSKLNRSNPTRSTLPSTILVPNSIAPLNCSAVMFRTAGLLMAWSHCSTGRCVVGSTATVLSRMMRAKQWSRVTGQWGWEGSFWEARRGRVCV